MTHIRRAALLAALAALTLASIGSSRAEESQFGYVYTTDLLPKGAKELEQWATWRHQKIAGYFDQIDARTEFEYGLADNLQTAIYANYAWTRAYHNGPFGATTPPEPFVYDMPGPDQHYSATRFVGVSGEVIYRVLSPYTDALGVAFGASRVDLLSLAFFIYVCPATVPIWFPYLYICYAAGSRWGFQFAVPVAGLAALSIVLVAAARSDMQWSRVISWLAATAATFSAGAGLAFLGERSRVFASQNGAASSAQSRTRRCIIFKYARKHLSGPARAPNRDGGSAGYRLSGRRTHRRNRRQAQRSESAVDPALAVDRAFQLRSGQISRLRRGLGEQAPGGHHGTQPVSRSVRRTLRSRGGRRADGAWRGVGRAI